jgi:hypothetical protein
MAKPSTDTATERAVARYRDDGYIPARMTLRFLALLTKKELAELDRDYSQRTKNQVVPLYSDSKKQKAFTRFLRARLERIQSERRQRGHIR